MKTLYCKERKTWRLWLEKHFSCEAEIWLEYPKKATGKPRIVYNDAVEEALCFNWIDSTVKSLNSETTIQRFIPRRPTSTYSQANRERLKWLMAQNLIHPSFQEKIQLVIQEPFLFPKDIIARIKMEPEIWDNYQAFSDGYKRIRIAYIDSARKRPPRI